MELQLFRKTTIGEVKRQFSKSFPYLKLEVFSWPCASRNASPMQQRLNDNLLLAQIKTFYCEGAFSFQPSMTVTEFESLLQKEFGLSVQVFRRSGSLWQETIQNESCRWKNKTRWGKPPVSQCV